MLPRGHEGTRWPSGPAGLALGRGCQMCYRERLVRGSMEGLSGSTRPCGSVGAPMSPKPSNRSRNGRHMGRHQQARAQASASTRQTRPKARQTANRLSNSQARQPSLVGASTRTHRRPRRDGDDEPPR